jgi:hypothetical protein
MVQPMFSDKLKLLFKKLNPSAKCWYDNKKFVQSGVSCQAFSYTR